MAVIYKTEQIVVEHHKNFDEDDKDFIKEEMSGFIKTIGEELDKV